MKKNRVGSRGDRKVDPELVIDLEIVVAGTMAYTPPQLLNPLPSDTLRIGVPIMRPGFITMTGLQPPANKPNFGSLPFA